MHGKGDKPRMTFVGPKTLKALVAYLRHRPEAADSDPLWLDERGHRLSATALRAILVRRAKLAGVPAPTPHQFRRAFALAALRNGCDLISLQRLMGHSDLTVLRRYLAQTEADLSAAHRRASPVDALLDGRR
jgi:integrase/recombinase XerD